MSLGEQEITESTNECGGYDNNEPVINDSYCPVDVSVNIFRLETLVLF